MKKQILLTLVILTTTTSSVFAESLRDNLQAVETSSCSNIDLIKTIKKTATNLAYTEKKVSEMNVDFGTERLAPGTEVSTFAKNSVTVIEDGLGITNEQKQNGVSAKLVNVAPSSSLKNLEKSIKTAEQQAATGHVGIIEPMQYDVTWLKTKNGIRQKQGRFIVDVTCRVETVIKDGKSRVKHTAQLASFTVDQGR